MVEFDERALDEVINQYVSRLDETRPQELYKWEAVHCFQDNWNPDAEDFPTMLEAALGGANNLLTSYNYYAKGMLIGFAGNDPEGVRSALLALFDGSADLESRCKAFQTAMNGQLENLNVARAKEGVKPAGHGYQDAHAISVYLSVEHPETYYLYKQSNYKAFAKRVGAEKPSGGSIAKLISYGSLLDEVLSYVKKIHPEAIAKSDSLLSSELQGADPAHHMLVQDLVYFCQAYASKRAWLYAPGENAAEWDAFKQDGIMAIGWQSLGDLSAYDSQDALEEKLQLIEKTDGSKKNDALCCWQFQHDIHPGDIVYAKRGRSLLIGRGVVKSDARYEPDRGEWCHVRKVEWDKDGSWAIAGGPLPQKTLTEITDESDQISSFESLINGPATPKADESERSRRYWWLVASPKIWSFSDIRLNEEQSYTLKNENGNYRRIRQNYLDARPGDAVIGYEGTPVKKVVALCEVARAHDDERLYFKKVKDLPDPIAYEDIKRNPALSGMEFLKNPNGSFFKLTKDEYDGILDMLPDAIDPVGPLDIRPYTESDFLADVFMDAQRLYKLEALVERKRNVILQGAPGTGKTYAARRLAYVLMGKEDDSHVQLVQFHQNTTYEDFVGGYRPDEDGSGFHLEPGIFVRFCRKAAADPDGKWFFIIDEINRANISKVFGELLMLIERDHRGEEAVLTVSGRPFSVPSNVYIIGMMNTADRGLALIDYALRRRFAFFEMEPAFGNPGFEKVLKGKSSLMQRLAQAVRGINEDIAEDPSLGRGFRIGHSYFLEGNGSDEEARSVAEFEIEPLLEEYWFDDAGKVGSEKAKIDKALG